MCPLQIHCMLEIYVGSHLTAPDTDTRKSVLSGFARVGLIEANSASPSGYDATDLGKAYCHLLVTTPIPLEKFVDPRTDEIIEWGGKV